MFYLLLIIKLAGAGFEQNERRAGEEEQSRDALQ